MTRRVLSEAPGGRGRVIAIDESPEERAERIERAAAESTKRFRLTPGQRSFLARAGARSR